MRKVYLHGALGAKHGDCFELEVGTAAEAVRALAANIPTIMMDLREGAWHIVRGEEIDDGIDLDETMCVSFQLGNADLHIVPVIAGSKRGGALKIILGVALVGFGMFMGFATPLLSTASGAALGGLTYGNVAMIGVAMAVAGVSQMLTPEEKTEESKDSFMMSGPGNAYSEGNPVPLIYGTVITGSHLISGGVDVERI